MNMKKWSEVNNRKSLLAGMVYDRLAEKGMHPKLYEKRENTSGHTDDVVVWASQTGFIHISAHTSKSINASDFQKGMQNYLADKSMIAFGWQDENEVDVYFVPVSFIKGNSRLSQQEIIRNSDGKYNFSIKNSFP